MVKKICSFLSSIPMTAVSGISLVISFILAKLKLDLFFDPAVIAVIISGLPLFVSAARKLVSNKGISKISSALLISIATLASIIIGDVFAAGEVVFIMALGEILEDLTTDRAKRGLKKLISLTPVSARIIKDGKEETVPAECVKAGDVVRIFAGESIPVDGIIVSGKTSVDASVVTGESLPTDKGEGDTVYCASINRFGVIDVKATATGESSSLSKLIRLVEEAEKKKAPTARIADRWASLLVPVALVIAIITGIITRDIVRAVTILVVFCPCALVLATPTAIMAAIGQATKRGVIIKSGEALEKMGRVDTVAFDKTGTLTYGRLHVSKIISYNEKTNEEAILSLASSLESKSEHPLGQAIVLYAKEKELPLIESEEFEISVGLGVSGRLNTIPAFCGNERFLTQNGIDTSVATDDITALQGDGEAVILIALGGECIGLISLSDTVREEAQTTVSRLLAEDVDAILLTGDNAASAGALASLVGIKSVFANLLPEDKLSRITDLQKSGRTVCMVGDGINDAPSLKSADVGVAMGGVGSDIAVESADIALVGDGISSLPYLKRLARATISTIKLCIFLSMAINVVAVILSVMGVLTPTSGALVHNAGSFFVILISALLYDRKF